MDGDACAAQPPVQEHLRDQATEGVTHQDRRLGQAAHESVVMIDDLSEPDIRRRLGEVEFLVELRHARPCGRADGVARRGVALYPTAPAVRRHPQSVDQDNRCLVGRHRL